MKSWYTELLCDHCQEPLCYYIDCGPRGSAICAGCYEDEDEEDTDPATPPTPAR